MSGPHSDKDSIFFHSKLLQEYSESQAADIQVTWHERDTSLNEFIFISAHKPRGALYIHIKAQAGVRLVTYPYLVLT